MAAASTPLKALIVDDEMTNRLILRSLLKKLNYQTVEAEDGQQAVDMFRQHNPNMIFMDVMMPVMDGYEATRRIKQDAGKRFVPIIFLTAITDESALQGCIDAGGDDFLTKPYDKFVLQTKIQAMERIAKLNKEIEGMYSLIHREQEIAEQVFIHAIQKNNIQNPLIRSVIRPAGTFSGDMILSAISPSRDIHFLLGDFTGHGLASALGAMPVSEVFRAMTAKGFGPDEILTGINKKLRGFLPSGMFLCVQLISISHDLDHVTVYNMGMPDLLLIDGKTQKIKRHIQSTGLPLAIVDDINTRESIQEIALDIGDRLLFYSDGLTEAWSKDGEEFGEQRLYDAINESQDSYFECILERFDDFCGDHTQADDVTLIEITCDTELLPSFRKSVDNIPRSHAFETRGDWEYVFNLKDRRLLETNPVPIIINHIMEMEGIETERQSLFTVLTELYVNALDHGVLGLDSSLKSDPSGFAQYFQEREHRLKALTDGHVTFHLAAEQEQDLRSILIRVEDSGKGFEYDQLPVPAPTTQLQLSGRGIILIRDLCESLKYYGKGNVAEAIFSWKTH